MAAEIFLADDEKNIRDLMKTFLVSAGYTVRAFENGDELLRACADRLPDLVILDVMMPGTDGLSVCAALRARSPALPLLIVSAKDDPYDRVTGLSVGSDDYMVKPFLPLELVARVKALLRRAAANERPKEEPALTFGALTLDKARRTAALGGRELLLTPTEFAFFAYMIAQNGRAVSRKELLDALWAMDFETDTRAADDLVKRLRKKLRGAGGEVEIETVWGYGFRLAADNGKGDTV